MSQTAAPRTLPAASLEGVRVFVEIVRAGSLSEAARLPELAAILTDELGKEVSYVDLAPEIVAANMVKNGLPQAFADDLVRLQTNIARGQGGFVSPTVPTLLGRPARSFRTFVQDHAASFR